MAKYGGHTRYGGTAHFGGGVPLAVRYYRILKTMLLPGCWSQEDGTLINNMLFGDAILLDHAKTHVRRLWAEIFPHTMSELLEEWESLLGVRPYVSQTRDQRKTAVIERWRGGQPSTLKGYRTALAPFLSPEYAINDDYADGNLDWRFDQIGTGTVAETGGALVLTVAGATDTRWDGVHNSPLMYAFRVADRADDFTLTAQLSTWSAANDTATGLVIYDDYQNATMLALNDTGGTEKLQVDVIQNGTLTENFGAFALAVGVGVVTRLSRVGSTLSFYQGATESTLTLMGTVPLAHGCRYFGAFARNKAASGNAVSVSLGWLKLQFATAANNVPLFEQRLSNLHADNPDQIFFTFVWRRPGDAGVYDLTSAQRLADRMAPGHVLIAVGESCVFQVNDPYSLTDRDILGL
jgi:hypothetical protein